jgi:thioredoxin reductase
MRGEPAESGNWITIEGRHIFIAQKTGGGKTQTTIRPVAGQTVPGELSKSTLGQIETVRKAEAQKGVTSPITPDWLTRHAREQAEREQVQIETTPGTREQMQQALSTFKPRQKGFKISL